MTNEATYQSLAKWFMIVSIMVFGTLATVLLIYYFISNLYGI